MQHKAKATINTFLLSRGLGFLCSPFTRDQEYRQAIRAVPNLNDAYCPCGEGRGRLYRATP